jgi:hypothetical protein
MFEAVTHSLSKVQALRRHGLAMGQRCLSLPGSSAKPGVPARSRPGDPGKQQQWLTPALQNS